MKPLLCALFFGLIAPLLHVVLEYPWQGGYIVITMTFTALLIVNGYVFGLAWRKAQVPPDEVTQVEVDPNLLAEVNDPFALSLQGKAYEHKSGGVVEVHCPVCIFGNGQVDHITYGANGKWELFRQYCANCGNKYISLRMKA